MLIDINHVALAYATTAATRCKSGAGEAAGAGVVSPTVPPETEDGSAERRPWHSVPFRLRQPDTGRSIPCLMGLAHGVGGLLAGTASSPSA